MYTKYVSSAFPTVGVAGICPSLKNSSFDLVSESVEFSEGLNLMEDVELGRAGNRERVSCYVENSDHQSDCPNKDNALYHTHNIVLKALNNNT